MAQPLNQTTMDHYAVMGFPVAHSKSPLIHHLFAEQTNQNLEYSRIEVPAEQFSTSLQHFVQSGGAGLNITVPLKQLAWQHMDELDDKAHYAEAVNTIDIRNNRLKGYNTDGIGLIRDLHNNHHIQIKNHSILILGAGGAVQGVLQPLLEHQPQQLTIANRTPAKAHALARKFSALGNIHSCDFAALHKQRFDIIINATSAGLHNQLPPLPDTLLKPAGITYDMVYSDQPTAFVHWGQTHNAAKALDGLGMLVEQAAAAFHIWRGLHPDTQPIINHLRSR